MAEPNRAFPETDPRYHTANIKGKLSELIAHLREDEKKIDDAQGLALFETTAEVLKGLCAAYEHYERGVEPAWSRR